MSAEAYTVPPPGYQTNNKSYGAATSSESQPLNPHSNSYDIEEGTGDDFVQDDSWKVG